MQIKTIYPYLILMLLYSKFSPILIAQNLALDSSLVFIEGGSFKMGDKKGEKDEKPVKRIRLNGFYISKYEVSNNEFAEFLNANGNQYEDHSIWLNKDGKWQNLKCRIYELEGKFYVEEGYEKHPVNFVSWFGANKYCQWKEGRLPTEAEWEYAAKGGKMLNKKNLKRFSSNLDKFAWFKLNSKQKWHQSGAKEPNEAGLFDISGNLWEWCSDFYSQDYYKTRVRKNPTGPRNGDFKVMRGGSWTNESKMLRLSNRNALNPNSNKINLGFRIVFDKTEDK